MSKTNKKDTGKKVTEYHPEDTSVKYDSVESHFKKIAPDDEKALKWYSNLLNTLNSNHDTLHIVNNMVWNHENNIYIFISYFKAKPPKEDERAFQKHTG